MAGSSGEKKYRRGGWRPGESPGMGNRQNRKTKPDGPRFTLPELPFRNAQWYDYVFTPALIIAAVMIILNWDRVMFAFARLTYIVMNTSIAVLLVIAFIGVILYLLFGRRDRRRNRNRRFW
ncbi:MAG: hypothetical protein K6C06_03115 [Lachnospiraceae bacterium]|nr:hypothetical protein [Lachnospiraceae bacterium]